MAISEYTTRYYRVQCDKCAKFLPSVGGGWTYKTDAETAISKAGWEYHELAGRNQTYCSDCKTS